MKTNVWTTHEPAFDAYLTRLDGLLVGARSVRALSLAEVADHLLEHRDLLLEAGEDRDQAVQTALDEFGPAEDYASAQRTSMFGRFWRLALIMGSTFTVLTAATQIVDGRLLPTWVLLLQGALFGPSMAGFVVYLTPIRRLKEDEFAASEFTVEYPRALRWMNRISVVGFGLLGLIGLAAGLGYDLIGLSPASGLIYAGLMSAVLMMIRRQLDTIHVGPEGLRVTRGLRTTTLRWDQVRQMRRRSRGRPWLYKFYWGQVFDVSCVDEDGGLYEFTVFPDALGASRLRFELERRLGTPA